MSDDVRKMSMTELLLEWMYSRHPHGDERYEELKAEINRRCPPDA